MKRNSLSASVMNNSNNAAFVEIEKPSKGKTSKPDVLKNSANSLDEDENESPKKKAVFDEIKKLFGFLIFDEDEFCAELIAKGNKMSVLRKLATAERKRINSYNEKIEGLGFDEICKKIEGSSLINDFSLFVGTSDLSTLKDNIINGNNVILFHGKQSEEGEKYESIKVTVKGLHKPYTDICYTSKVEISTSNILRAFRNYGYYLASVKRCKRMRREENTSVELLVNTCKSLRQKFGYMPEDLAKVLSGINYDEKF